MRVIAVIALSIAVLAQTGPAHAAASDIEAIVAKKAAIIRNMHDRATRAIVQVAQDPAFPSYFEASHMGHSHGAHEAKVRIDTISLATQEKFHVEEMCLIDATGSEVSRIVQNQIAYDLSTSEADNAFFAPSFERKARTTYIAPLYMSADVLKWVMAYTTPIEFEGKNAAILHYEHGLDVYQAALNKEPVAADTRVLAVDSHGLIVSDSRRPIAVEQHGDDEDPASYFEAFSLAGMTLEAVSAALGDDGVGTITSADGSYAVAVKAIADWTIVGVQEL